tara:strand:- start:195 stop:437 length:243 start_codon:yes stop_codon:yes gene_type:complete
MVNSDVPQMKQVKIWDVISGPYPCDIPDSVDVHYNLCKVEIERKIIHMEYFFDSFNDAYEMVKYFQSNIQPLEIEIDDRD